MSFFLNVETMQCVNVILVVSVCWWELNLPFTHGLKDLQYEKIIKPPGGKALSDQTKQIKKKFTLEAYKKDTEEETFSDIGIKPPPGHENDKVIEDSHRYYNSTFLLNAKDAAVYWVDLDKMPEEQVISHSMLSDSHRQATTIVLSFDFPFYGNNLRNITIATGGFLYMGDYLHNWIAATQYIAPLMANFDTSISPNSTIKYADNGTTFTVQWNKVSVQDKDKDGFFTFQVTLIKNGDIIFAYKEIPYSVLNISDTDHPVKIGLSDAYLMERQTFFIRRKTIFEYHRVDFLKQSISDNTAIYFTALPTCLSFHDCESCVTADKTLECVWCESVKRCSDGVDRLRQNWLQNSCLFESQSGKCSSINSTQTTLGTSTLETTVFPLNRNVSSTPFFDTTQSSLSTSSVMISEKGSSLSTSPKPTSNESIMRGEVESMESYVQESASVHSVTPGAIVAIIVVLAAIAGVGFWIYYAYKFPQSSSGQFLIKYRPSQWNVKPEESNCNSAAFHM